MKIKKEKRGGYRKNARRPLKYGEPTVTISFRVPKSLAKTIREFCNLTLQAFIDGKSTNKN